MRLLPLVLSAHPSVWNADAGGLRRERTVSPDSSCQFCGFQARGWQESFHLNGDHDDDSPGNLTVACVLCNLTQQLGRPTIDAEAMLIWLPEMSPAALNAVARRIHHGLQAQGEPPHMERRPQSDTPELRALYSAFTALRERGAAAQSRLGTISPRALGAALLGLDPAAYERRASLLGGTRLLPRGRFYRDGQDVYPRLLEAFNPTRDLSP
jgi:intracellular multiplication protein IcmJ